MGPIMNKAALLQLASADLGRLRSLRLVSCSLQKDAAAASPDDTAHTLDTSNNTAVQLVRTELEISNCVLSKSQLRSCTALQQLHLSFMAPPNSSNSDSAAVPPEDLLAAALPQLRQLTCLSIDAVLQGDNSRPLQFDDFSDALSDLKQLKVLEIGCDVIFPGYTIEGLPTSLHTLKVSSHTGSHRKVLSMEAEPYLEQLTNLRQLQLDSVRLTDSWLLLSCYQMTRLDLINVKIGDQSDDSLITDDDPNQIRLLEAIQHLELLRHLNLSKTLRSWLHDVESYLPLITSADLTYLDLMGCVMDPGVAWEIFQLGPPCNRLLQLKITSHLLESKDSYGLLHMSCPALRHLEIANPYGREAVYRMYTDEQSIYRLQCFEHLTSLHITGLHVSDDYLLYISLCKHLRDLDLLLTGTTTGGLSYLTKIMSLTRLSFKTSYTDQPEDIYLNNQAPAGCPPDVHQQLKSHLKELKEQ